MDENSFLLNNSELFDSLTENLQDAIVLYRISDKGLAAVYANEPFYQLTEFTSDDIIGMQPIFSSQKEQLKGNYFDIIESVKREEFVEREVLCLTKNGSPFWVQIKSSKLKETAHSDKFQLLVLRDITKRKKKETELEKAVVASESSKKIKERFLANMSHEIRTPINGIMGMAQLLETTNLNKEQKEYLEELKLSSENLLAIVNDILEFNFIESGALKLEIREFNIRKQLEQLVEIMQVRADEKKLKLDLIVSEKVPEKLIGDSVHFSQILMNLVGNAIKFTQEGGVVIFVRMLDESNGRASLEVKVKDTGIGIPASLLNDIFESFNQASKVTTYKYGGTGLGLSIADQLVKRMDGTIRVKSNEGEGTVFTVVVPFEMIKKDRDVEPQPPESSEQTVEVKLDGVTILVVDDYLINRKIVKRMLEKIGATVDQAETGEEALELIDANNYSVVLMDVHMPGMGGLAATKKIREHSDENKRQVPIVAVTASVLQKDIQECKKAGMDDFIAKPLSKKDLVDTVTAILEKDENYATVFDSVEDVIDDENFRIDSLMEMTGGDKNMIKEMIEIFMEQTPVMMEELAQSFKDKEFIKMSTSAHTLKPTFTYMDMERAYALAADIEELGKETSPEEKVISEKLEELQTLCDLSTEKLRRVLATLF